MLRMQSITFVACVAGALCWAPVAGSQAAPKGQAVVATVSATATVAKIDQKTREITLKADNGQTYSFVAGDAVQNFAQIKKGDVVTATYTEAVAYEVKKGGGAPGAAVTAGAAAAEAGAKPAGAVGAQVSVTAKITAIDPAAPSITFTAPSGDSRTVKVKYPEKLKGLAVGDLVELRYTEALAIKIEEKAKK